jgi:TPR repeat protein
MFNLATHYDEGFCGIRDHEQARYWCQKAADAGIPQALDKLNAPPQ